MKILVCGSRMEKNYSEAVFYELDKLINENVTIIEGCCPNSADKYAEYWAEKNNKEIIHFPARKGNYLKRNIEMVNEADSIIAFWDFWSYGTSFVISRASALGKPVKIIKIGDKS